MALGLGGFPRGGGGGVFADKTETLHPGGGTWSSYRNSRGKRLWWIGLIPAVLEVLRWM
jgi:hypothetical protein